MNKLKNMMHSQEEKNTYQTTTNQVLELIHNLKISITNMLENV